MQCLADFVDGQLNYYNSCTKVLQDLSKQIGGAGLSANRISQPVDSSTPNSFSSAFGPSQSLTPNFTNKKKAKVLFDFEATDPSEISVWANQVINQIFIILLILINFKMVFLKY